MSFKRLSLLASVLAGGVWAVSSLTTWAPATVSAGGPADEPPAPEQLARAEELSSAFRWVSKRTLPAIVSIRSVRKLSEQRQTMADPFEGSPFGRQFGGTPFEDLFGDLRERMRQQQGQGGESPGVATGEGSGFIIDSKGVIMNPEPSPVATPGRGFRVHHRFEGCDYDQRARGARGRRDYCVAG